MNRWGNGQRVRMILTDLDGTLLRDDGTLSDRNFDAIQRWRAVGVPVVIATGRPQRWLSEFPQQLASAAEVIALNGALTFDCFTGQILESHTLSARKLMRIYDLLRAQFPKVAFAVETADGFVGEYRFPGVTDENGVPDENAVEAMEDSSAAALKVLAWVPAARDGQTIEQDMLAKLSAERLRGIANVVHSGMGDPMIEISARGVSKAAAAQQLVRSYGILPQEVAAFGDGPNDIEMLKWAGQGFAMQDGHQDALAAAPHMAPSSRNAGVAQVLETLYERQYPSYV